MQKIKQFRFSCSQSNVNFSNIEKEKMFGQNIFKANQNENFSHVKQIGIQGIPGTCFWLNDGFNSLNPQAAQGIVLNWTGIFELDLTSFNGEINSLMFSNDSYFLYTDHPESKLIVDILYEDNVGGVI